MQLRLPRVVAEVKAAAEAARTMARTTVMAEGGDEAKAKQQQR